MNSTSRDAGLPTTAGGTACPVCRAPALPGADADGLTLYRCGGCGSWSSDAGVRGATTSFQPRDYFAQASADEPRWAELLQRLGHQAGQPQQLLDVGCGTGAWLAYAARVLPRSQRTGIELDADRAGLARRNDPAARIHTGDAAGVAAGLTGRYDLITLWDLLEHVPDPRALVGILGQRLAPGGRLFIQTIHEDSLLPRLGRLSYTLTGGAWRGGIRRTHDAHHLVFFSRRGLALLAAAAGLEIEAQWFGRLALARLDGSPLLTWPAAALMTLENAWGNGLFVNLLLRAAPVTAHRAGPRDP